MRYILTRSCPPFARVLLVESGSRALLEHAIRTIHRLRSDSRIDVVTCYAGSPAGLTGNSTVFRTGEYHGSRGRARLLGDLRRRGYDIMGIICSDEPIMTKWKWWLALRMPAKVFVINENGDWFWLDRVHLRVITHFAMGRAGFTGAGAASALGRIAALPFIVVYLVGFAAWIHFRRLLRHGHATPQPKC